MFERFDHREHGEIDRGDRETTRTQKPTDHRGEPNFVVRETLDHGHQNVEHRGREESSGLDC